MSKPTQQLTCPFCQSPLIARNPPTSNGGDLYVAEELAGTTECYDTEAHPYVCPCTGRTIYIGEG